MAPIIFALGVVFGTILLIIFTEVLEKPVLSEIKRIKYEVSLLRHYLRAGLEVFTQQLALPAT